MVPPVESSRTRDRSTALVGVVVAGGASSRFGRDKALAILDGETLVERARRILAEICPEVVIADAGRGLLPGSESVPDGPGRGPAAAILGAAARRPGRALLVLACDLPRVPAALLERICGAPGDWVVPRADRGLEPLCAVYRPRALEELAALVEAGENALHQLSGAALAIHYLETAAIADLGDPREIFANVNTPDDLRRLAGEG